VIGVVVVIVVAVAAYFLNASGILSQITFPFPSPTPGQGISGIPTIAATLGTQSPAETETPTPTEAGGAATATQGRIAFVSTRDGNFEIYVLDVAANRVTRLTNDPASDRNPAWSPDGKQIIFVSDRSGTDNLYMVSASGGTAVRLTVGPASDRNPAYAPDGQRIIFSRETIDGSRLVTMPTACLSDPETCESDTRLLTPGGYDRFPAFAPDGSKLAFAASDFPGGSSVIAMLNPDGSGYSSVRGTGSSDFGPSWGPDSTRLAFVSYADGDYDIWVMAADGSSLMQITNVDSADVSPSWSPDGGTLVYASDRGGDGSFDLYLVPSTCLTATGGCDTSPVRLTESAGDDLDPAWYPE
jgi:TolB protein